MEPRQSALVILLVVAMAPVASAQTQFEEVALPAGSMPLAITADDNGVLWLTLNGAWAFARYDPETEELDTFPLPTGPTAEREELFDVFVDGRGSVWTASNTHAFRLDAETGNVTAFELPSETDLSGGIAETADGIVIALVTADKVAVLDREDGTAREIEVDTLDTPDGPLKLASGRGDDVVGSSTYADGFFVLAGDAVEMRAAGMLRGPVGLVTDDTSVWLAEMGGSSVARSDYEGSKVERFPTTPSHYFELSGPSGIAVADGGDVWFVEHFADRIAILDVERGLLEEVQVPGAPGTNVQFLAFSEGRAWFPLMTKDKLVSMPVREAAEPRFTLDQDEFSVQPGGSFEVHIEPRGELSNGDLVAAPNGEEFTFEPGEGGALKVTMNEDAEPGTYRFLVSFDETNVARGRYVTVSVEGEEMSQPGLGAVAVLLVVALAAVGLGRPSSR